MVSALRGMIILGRNSSSRTTIFPYTHSSIQFDEKAVNLNLKVHQLKTDYSIELLSCHSFNSFLYAALFYFNTTAIFEILSACENGITYVYVLGLTFRRAK